MNTGGPASEKTLLDEFAGQALGGLLANPGGPVQANGMTGWGFANCNPDFIAGMAYSLAESMLAEKARREADRSDGKAGRIHSESAIIRAGWDLFTWADKTMDETDECRVFLHNWKDAVVKESSTTDHSPDAGKMATLKAMNRELVEAVEEIIDADGRSHEYFHAVAHARELISKAKEVA